MGQPKPADEGGGFVAPVGPHPPHFRAKQPTPVRKWMGATDDMQRIPFLLTTKVANLLMRHDQVGPEVAACSFMPADNRVNSGLANQAAISYSRLSSDEFGCVPNELCAVRFADRLPG